MYSLKASFTTSDFVMFSCLAKDSNFASNSLDNRTLIILSPRHTYRETKSSKFANQTKIPIFQLITSELTFLGDINVMSNHSNSFITKISFKHLILAIWLLGVIYGGKISITLAGRHNFENNLNQEQKWTFDLKLVPAIRYSDHTLTRGYY